MHEIIEGMWVATQIFAILCIIGIICYYHNSTFKNYMDKHFNRDETK